MGFFSKSSCKVLWYEADSRAIQPGSLFFALPGQRQDGHDFLQQASEKGAIAAVVDKSYQGASFGLELFRVSNVLEALQRLAQELLQERGARILGVTGSVGKTTSKEFLWTLLLEKFQAGKTPLNKNTKISLPLSLLQMQGSEKMVVLEMGMTQAQEIARLIEIAPPEIALITNVALAHAESFPDGLLGIAKAKMEIFSHAKTKLGIIPRELLFYEKELKESSCPKKTFSLQDPRADFYLERKGDGFILHEDKQQSPQFFLPFQETHFIQDTLAALSMARSVGMSYEEIIPRLKELKPPAMRFEKIEKRGILFINDCYNASPLSIQAALSNLPKPKKRGRRIAVLGEMPHLGAFAEEEYKKVGAYAAEFADILLCLGEKCSSMCESFTRQGKTAYLFATHAELRQKLDGIVKENDVVLIKGSRAMQMEKILLDKE